MKHEQLTVSDIRQINKLNVLACLLEQERMTISQLAKRCGATVVTMGKIVQSLVDDGIVLAHTNDTGSVGRHGLIYEINLEIGVFACIDVTFRDKLFARIYDIKRNCLGTYERSVVGGGYFAQFNALVSDIMRDLSGKTVLGVGVSTAGEYNKTRDRAASMLFDWYHDVGYSGVLRKHFSTHNILIEQDISFAALAESKRLSMQPNQSMYYLYVGDGISGVFIKNGKIHEGVDGLARNPGKMLVTWGNRLVRVEETLTKDWQREERFEDRMRPLFTVISNVLWLLNPDYFIFAANEMEIADRLRNGTTAFFKNAADGKMSHSTKFLLSDNCNASQAGVLQKLIDRYLRAL